MSCFIEGPGWLVVVVVLRCGLRPWRSSGGLQHEAELIINRETTPPLELVGGLLGAAPKHEGRLQARGGLVQFVLNEGGSPPEGGSDKKERGSGGGEEKGGTGRGRGVGSCPGISRGDIGGYQSYQGSVLENEPE